MTVEDFKAMPKETQQKALIVIAVAETICEAGPQGIPSGHLYAAVSSRLSLEVYQGMIVMLINKGLVRQSNHLLTWTGK